MRRVVSLFLPTLATDRLRRQSPEPPPPDAPLLTAMRDGSRRLVAAVDARAQAAGLFPGMAVSHAQARVPGLVILPAEPEADAEALRRLAAWCLRWSPLASPCPPDGVWIDITGCAHLAGGEPALLDAIARRLIQAGLAVRAAIAGTPGAAHACAHHAADALTIVPPGGEAEALAPLPVAALRLPPETIALLRRLGFDTVGAVLAAPRAPLLRRLGPLLVRRLDQALGRVPEPIEPVLPPERPRARLGFPEPIATPEDLARATALLAESLCERLQRRGLGALRLDLVAERVDGTAAWLRVGTHAASRDAAHLRRLLGERLETIDPGFGIAAMLLTASVTTGLGAQQEGTLGGSGPDLSPLFDTLSNRLGEGRLFRLAAVESDLPERAVARLPPLVPAATSGAWPPSLPRPLRLFEPPHRIDALSMLPDGAPVRFAWRRHWHRVHKACGPERVYGEWWVAAEESWLVRDYFRVEDETGQRFWLFRRGDGRDPESGDMTWHLHGLGA